MHQPLIFHLSRACGSSPHPGSRSAGPRSRLKRARGGPIGGWPARRGRIRAYRLGPTGESCWALHVPAKPLSASCRRLAAQQGLSLPIFGKRERERERCASNGSLCFACLCTTLLFGVLFLLFFVGCFLFFVLLDFSLCSMLLLHVSPRLGAAIATRVYLPGCR